MEKFDLEPVELNDDELAAVAGGFTVSLTNATVSNSFNASGNITISNSMVSNSSLTG